MTHTHIVDDSITSHYLHRCCCTGKWTLMNNYKCNLKQSTAIFIQWIQNENAVSKMVDILSWSQCANPDKKVHGANMGPTWVLSAPDGPHVGPMNFAMREGGQEITISKSMTWGLPHNNKTLGNIDCPGTFNLEAGIVLDVDSTNERRCYVVTPPLIGWAHTQNGITYHELCKC